MPLELLRELSRQKLPVTVSDAEKLDKLRVLRAADQIACTVLTPFGKAPFARVLAITKDGHAALALDDIRRRRDNST